MKEYIVVTGASSGIGQALAIELANKGYNVLAIGRNEIGLQRTKSSATSGAITTLVADLCHEDAIENIAKQFNADTKIKYLVHCAAVLEPATPLLQANQHDLTVNITTNLLSPLALTQKLMAHFNPSARVLFMGSDYVGTDNKINPGVSGMYAISKTALKVAVEYLRQECRETVLIGYLNPGSTKTPLYARFWQATNTRETINSAAASPVSVAGFISNVLENSNNSVFTSTDWDYRTAAHHAQVEPICALRAKL